MFHFILPYVACSSAWLVFLSRGLGVPPPCGSFLSVPAGADSGSRLHCRRQQLWQQHNKIPARSPGALVIRSFPSPPRRCVAASLGQPSQAPAAPSAPAAASRRPHLARRPPRHRPRAARPPRAPTPRPNFGNVDVAVSARPAMMIAWWPAAAAATANSRPGSAAAAGPRRASFKPMLARCPAEAKGPVTTAQQGLSRARAEPGAPAPL
jgi:hypothetical protein